MEKNKKVLFQKRAKANKLPSVINIDEERFELLGNTNISSEFCKNFTNKKTNKKFVKDRQDSL